MALQTSDPAAFDRVLARVREARFSRGFQCVHCGDAHVQLWGQFSGRQRYRCVRCRRTFSDFTGTPMVYSKKPALWPDYASCLGRSMTVRQAACTVGLSLSTAFRWRHALLTEIRRQDLTILTGWIELTDLWFPYSEKGSRSLGRRPRHRGVTSRLLYQGRSVRVIVACDRLGEVVTDVVHAARVSAGDLAHALAARIAHPLIIVAAQGPLGPCAVFARRVGGDFQEYRPGWRTPEPLCHLRTATDYDGRLRGWMLRFRGVATRYLSNYLAWHRLIDRNWRKASEFVGMRWPIIRRVG